MINYIVREDGQAVAYNVDEGKKIYTTHILEEEYPYIYEHMKKENFKLKHSDCNIFKELLHENKVVGFVTYNTEDGMGMISLNGIYVLPEFRGNGFFKNDIIEALENNISYSIADPNHLIIDLLIEHGFAKKLNENLVASAISLDVSRDFIECNDDDYEIDDLMIYASNLYDSFLSAMLVLIDISSTPESNIIVYSKLQDCDIQYADAKKNRMNIKEHLEKVKTDMLSNQEEFPNILIELKRNLPKAEYDMEDLVGKPGELSEIFIQAIDENLVSYERAIEIQEQIIDEYDMGEVLNESLLKRITYLMIEDRIDDEMFDDDLSEYTCPYCCNEINLTDDSCEICGYNLKYTPEISVELLHERIKDISQMINSSREQIRGRKGYALSLSEVFTGIREVYSLEDSVIDLSYENLLVVTSYLLLTYLKDFDSLDEACDYAALVMDMDEKELSDYVIEMGYVDKTLCDKSWDLISQKLTVKNLKDILRKEGLKISGKKAELIKRIRDNVNIKKIKVTDYLDLKDGYIISEKGLKYLENNEYLDDFRIFLEKFDLNDFKKYYTDNKEKDMNTILIDFLEVHEDNALKNEDDIYYYNVLIAKRKVYNIKKISDDDFLFNEIKIFSYNMNRGSSMFFTDDGKDRLNTDNVKNLRKLSKKTDINHVDLLNKTFYSTAYEKCFSIDEMLYFLEEIFKGTPLNVLRKELFQLRCGEHERFNHNILDKYI